MLSTDPLRTIEEETRVANNYMHAHTKGAFQRYPVLFSLLSTFGIVAVLYGFDGILNSIPLFHNNPILPLILGITVLVFTGTLYKKLNKKLD